MQNTKSAREFLLHAICEADDVLLREPEFNLARIDQQGDLVIWGNPVGDPKQAARVLNDLAQLLGSPVRFAPSERPSVFRSAPEWSSVTMDGEIMPQTEWVKFAGPLSVLAARKLLLPE